MLCLSGRQCVWRCKSRKFARAYVSITIQDHSSNCGGREGNKRCLPHTSQLCEGVTWFRNNVYCAQENVSDLYTFNVWPKTLGYVWWDNHTLLSWRVPNSGPEIVNTDWSNLLWFGQPKIARVRVWLKLGLVIQQQSKSSIHKKYVCCIQHNIDL